MKKGMKFFMMILTCLFLVLLFVLVFAYIIPPGRTYDYESQFLKENQTEFVEINGCNVHYLHKGEGEPLILIHSGAAWLYSFRNNIDELSKQYSVYALDMPGHGYTTYPKSEKLDLDYVGTILNGFMEKMNIDKASLVGNSWGGGWALYFAQEFPEKTNKLVLIDAVGLKDSVQQDMSIWPLMNYPVLGEVIIHFFTYGSVKAGYMFYDKSTLDESVFKEYYKPLTFTHNLKAQVNYQRNLDWSISDEKLSSMETPTLILWGKQDTVLPVSMAYEYEMRIKNSKLKIYDESNHLPHEEKSEEVNKLIIDFLEE